MTKGYLFISNSTKPSDDVLESLLPIGPDSFSRAAIWAANEMNWTLHMGVNRSHPEQIKSVEYDIKFYDQHSYRNIFAFWDNWTAYRNLCRYLKQNPQIEIIHCNTPIGGVVGRLAGKRFKKKVIYTAHGFHFYKGAPFYSRTILKWIEQFLARYTDILITINQEDYDVAKGFKLKSGGRVVHIPGVGIDLSSYNLKQVNREDKRKELGISNKDFVLISMGDLVPRKNYSVAIEAMSKTINKNIHYLICGEGAQKNSLINLSKDLFVDDRVHFLGFRRDIKELLSISDMFLFTSLQEGLPRSTMEAMAAGLPCVVSDIRGNRDLIDEGQGGYLVSPFNSQLFVDRIEKLYADYNLRQSMSLHNQQKIAKYDITFIQTMMLNLFKKII